ncbi:hypothetical protein ACFRIB_38505 [Streptomyces mirabilis]|uniref:hypothetical protein n=1 Tax=Streptomyces mirabilis TaxID=68239 RepID=UPI0036A3A362
MISVGSPDRLDLLLEHVTCAGIDVVIGLRGDAANLPSGSMHMMDTAAAIVLAAGDPITADQADPGRNDDTAHMAQRGLTAGLLVPVRLGQAAFPTLSSRLAPVDLHDWRGGDHPELDRLVQVLLRFIARRHGRLFQSAGYNLDNPWLVERSRQTVSELQKLTRQVGQLSDLLLDDNQHTTDLITALDEVGVTYEAVNNALSQFMSAGRYTGTDKDIDRLAYHRLARQNLMEQIHNGRGSCTRIERVYRRVGGLRGALEEVTSPELLAQADDAFGQFASADGDLFARLEDLGETLTSEARAIEGLLITGQDDAARQRIIDGAQRLHPVEESVTLARRELRKIQDRLGYTRTATTTEVSTVNFKTITISGGVFHAPVVIADKIERTVIMAATAPTEELATALTDLAKSVATMSAALPEDEAELAAHDLEEITTLATSGEDKPARWRRAIDGLLSTAQRAAEVGAPVVDLVTKITQLVS